MVEMPSVGLRIFGLRYLDLSPVKSLVTKKQGKALDDDEVEV
jgi:hypothetical protein